MFQQNFRVFVYNPDNGQASSRLHDLKNYVGLNELVALDEIQGYDLSLNSQIAGPELDHLLAEFCTLHLADPVIEVHLIQKFSDASTEQNSWQEWVEQNTTTGCPPGDFDFLCYESLAVQFDPRAQAVWDCWSLWAPRLPAQTKMQLRSVRCFWLYWLRGRSGRLQPQSLNSAHRYLWAPLERQVKNLAQFSYSARSQAGATSLAKETAQGPILPSLLSLRPEASQLRAWADRIGLRFDDASLAYIHAYYGGGELPGLRTLENPREPSLTELRVLEAYWSDHCRHTTFNTELQWQKASLATAPLELRQAFQLYRELRQQCGISHKTECLMDIAVLGAQAIRKKLQASGKSAYMDAVEISAEVNACSIFVDVEDAVGQKHRRLLMFKNETHNHPTEIEPYGGAATCLGGAIRDPLSGRSFVYQSMRLSGAASPDQELNQARPGKLPQRKIAAEAARGFSDYGNCIGLANNLVREIYHPGFEAKRFECGVAVGVADPRQVRRLEPRPGDLVLLLGGPTGRDGIGGASGSSAAHDSLTVAGSSAEVQRGNPIEERKLQRFFRRQDVGNLIKRCNDFGAGGLAVAVGEIAESLEIELSAMPTKYGGLMPAELAVSESQERMAVVIDASRWEEFRQKAESEGISVVQLGQVQGGGKNGVKGGKEGEQGGGRARLRLLYHTEEVAKLQRDFLESAGFARSAKVCFDNSYLRPYQPSILAADLIRDIDPQQVQGQRWAQDRERALCQILAQPQVASQRGLQNMFDSSVGASTVFQPYPYAPQAAEVAAAVTHGRSEVSAQTIPLYYWSQAREPQTDDDDYRHTESRSVSLLSFAYDAHLSCHNSFLGAQVAIVQSVGKLLAAGAERGDSYLSLQEYFPRLESAELWGQASAALLGALQAQHKLGLAAIGGKDSMSGNFEELQVPPVLCSFSVSTAPCSALRAANWQAGARHLYLLGQPADNLPPLQNPDYERIAEYWSYLEILKQHSDIQVAARLIGIEGIAAAMALFAFGSTPKRIILKIWETNYWQPYAADPSFSAVLLASSQPLPDCPWLRDLGHLEDCRLGDEAIFFAGGRLALDARSPAYRAWCRYENEVGYYPLEADAPKQLRPEEGDDKQGKRCGKLQQELLAQARSRPAPAPSIYARGKRRKIRLVVPVFPGSNSEDDMQQAFARAAAQLRRGGKWLQLEQCSPIINLLSAKHLQESLAQLARELEGAQILALPGGFSAGDEPDGSAKFIASVLREPQIARAIDQLLCDEGLILGICNGFQALIKSGLLPYGREWCQGAAYGREGLNIMRNRQGRHIADLELCRVCPTPSPWLSHMSGKDFLLPISHGEGRLQLPEALLQQLLSKRQVAAVYHRDVNGSFAGIEALCSADGRILGKMAHSERQGPMLYRNMPHDRAQFSLNQDIFRNGLEYFL